MGMFLDSKTPAEEYRRISQSRFFVDKTLIIKEISDSVSINEQRYFCLTRPRRFGKSIMAYMIASFFGNAEDTHRLFEPLRIAGERDDYTTHLNQHHVIFIDFSISPINSTSYAQYIRRIQTGLNTDLAKAYPDLEIKPSDSPWDVLNTVFQNTGEKFIFVMDEWDAAFYFPYMTESDRAAHLHFLKLLLKGQSYVEFSYMTGVLPIAKYSSGSELNMFAEYDMVVYGLLTYDSDAREVFIPNRELMDQFDALLLNNPNPGYADFIFSPEQPSRSSSYRIFSMPIF